MVKKKSDRPVRSKPQAQSSRRAGADVIAARIKTLRRRKAMTLEQLSNATSLDRGYLSRVERGQKTPSIAALLRIAAALGLQMAHLFGEAVEPSAITVVRRTDRKPFPGPSSSGKHSLTMVLPATNARRVSAYLSALGPTSTAGTAEHAGEEIIFVLQGQVEVEFADRSITLNEGDCIHFDGHLQHALRRSSSKPARAFIVVAQDLSISGRGAS